MFYRRTRTFIYAKIVFLDIQSLTSQWPTNVWVVDLILVLFIFAAVFILENKTINNLMRHSIAPLLRNKHYIGTPQGGTGSVRNTDV